MHANGDALDSAVSPVAPRNDKDGLPDLTQPAVTPGGTFRYRITVPAAGTCFLHPHIDQAGMPGVIVYSSTTVNQRCDQYYNA
ncbi:multicopper oxidase domain-containing protein [Nocardia sp. NPDC051981]|uniref:multicopper oxidase domain-containing protein n=1 Tax=Nocardia sp. NPDC051981 TaxID=3155417 RepID=UPI00341C8C8A